MADWKKIRTEVGHAAAKAAKKTGEVADLTAMRVKLKLLQGKRDEQYKQLGKLTYRQLKSGESQAEKIAPVVEELEELMIKMQVLVNDIARAKAQYAAQKEAAKKAEQAGTEETAADADAE